MPTPQSSGQQRKTASSVSTRTESKSPLIGDHKFVPKWPWEYADDRCDVCGCFEEFHGKGENQENWLEETILQGQSTLP